MARRHTMGHDGGGRHATNPAGAPRVTAGMVLAAAKGAGVEIKREGAGWSMWLVQKPGDVWRNLASTNFQALEGLRRIQDGTW